MNNAIKKNKLIYGMGAPVKGNTLLNYFKITKKIMPVILEINELRKNKYTPGTHIPVILEKDNQNLQYILYI